MDWLIALRMDDQPRKATIEHKVVQKGAQAAPLAQPPCLCSPRVVASDRHGSLGGVLAAAPSIDFVVFLDEVAIGLLYLIYRTVVRGLDGLPGQDQFLYFGQIPLTIGRVVDHVARMRLARDVV